MLGAWLIQWPGVRAWRLMDIVDKEKKSWLHKHWTKLIVRGGRTFGKQTVFQSGWALQIGMFSELYSWKDMMDCSLNSVRRTNVRGWHTGASSLSQLGVYNVMCSDLHRRTCFPSVVFVCFLSQMKHKQSCLYKEEGMFSLFFNCYLWAPKRIKTQAWRLYLIIFVAQHTWIPEDNFGHI